MLAKHSRLSQKHASKEAIRRFAIRASAILDHRLNDYRQEDRSWNRFFASAASPAASRLSSGYDPSSMLLRPETALGVIHFGEMLDDVTESRRKDGNGNMKLHYDLDIDPSSQLSCPETALGVIHSGEMLDDVTESRQKFGNGNLQQQYDLDVDSSSMLQCPETALGAVHIGEMLESDNGSSHAQVLDGKASDSLSMLLLSPETAIGAIHYGELLDILTESKLNAQQARKESIPRTLAGVLSDSRPMVVTSAASPFSVVEVNDAWVGLCGYTREEAVNCNLGDLLQGPETDENVARNMVQRLQKELYAEDVLTNYSKSGRKFDNFVKVARLAANGEGGNAEDLFIGVLEEIHTECNLKRASL